MKKIFVLSLLVLFFTVPPVNAKPTVKCNVKKISQHKLLVTFSWNVTVYSDKNWDICDLTISFRDSEGREIYAVQDRLKLKVGTNSFAGHEICDTKIWERIRKYVTTLDCVF